MADIDVTFATNASTAARQVDQMTASTVKASSAQRGQVAASTQHAAALKRSADAARQLAMEERKAEVALEKSAAAARQRTMQGASFLGLGRGAAGANAILGKDSGVGSLVMATAAMTGVGFAIGALSTTIDAWLSQSAESAKNIEDLSKRLQEIKDRNADLGTGAAQKFGPRITALGALGGDARELADSYGKRYGFADSSKAVLKAFELFPDAMEKALKEANDASRLTGMPLAESMAMMKGMPAASLGSGKAAGGVAGQFFGRAIPFDQITAMRDRNDNDPEILDIRRIQAVGGRLDSFGIDQIQAGMLKAIDDMVKVTTEHVDASNALKNATIENTKAVQARDRFWAEMGRNEFTLP